MEMITKIYSWYSAHTPDLLELWFGIIAVASIIVKLTPTLKDDAALKKVLQFLGKYVAINR